MNCIAWKVLCLKFSRWSTSTDSPSTGCRRHSWRCNRRSHSPSSHSHRCHVCSQEWQTRNTTSNKKYYQGGYLNHCQRIITLSSHGGWITHRRWLKCYVGRENSPHREGMFSIIIMTSLLNSIFSSRNIVPNREALWGQSCTFVE